jgi:chromosome segregation ATPase
VDQTSADATHILQADNNTIDAWLKGLWDRARKASELIGRLREEKGELQTRVASLEEEVLRMKQELANKEEMVRALSREQGDDRGSTLLNGEREQLSAKVKELLTKLDEYL